MINDKEAISVNEDKLKFKAYVETLEEIIKSAITPLTIGVYGKWGSGKTSLMKMTQNLLLKEKLFKTVWFDAWKYDKVEDLRVALIYNIIKQIDDDTSIPEKLKVKVSNFLKRINWLSLAKSVTSLGLSLLTPQLSAIGLINRNIAKDKLAPDIDLSSILPDEILGTASLESLKFLHEFENLYVDIIEQYIGSNGRLVVFIDDLDRCLPDKSIDILEAIKLFLSTEGSIFVIGVDREIIVQGIKIKYKANPETDGGWASNYLEKIIQLPFRLPPLRKDVITEDFINNLDVRASIKKYSSIIADVGDNPRSIKRVINNFELQRILANKRLLNIEEGIIAKLIVLEFRWPQFYKDFLNLYSNNKVNIIPLLINAESKNKLSVVNKYREDDLLVNFLKKPPIFSEDENDLDNFIYLARTNVQLKSDIEELFNLGISNLELKNPDEAIKVFSDALILDENNKEPIFYRAIAHVLNGDVEMANVDIENFKSTNVLSIEHLENLSSNLVEKKFIKEAKEYTDQLIGLSPENKIAINNILTIGRQGYSSEELINAASFALIKFGYKKDILDILNSLITTDRVDEKIINAFKAVLEEHVLDYKLIQSCLDYYSIRGLKPQIGSIYLLEGKAHLNHLGIEDAFTSFNDAYVKSDYNDGILTELINFLIEKNLSFEAFNYFISQIKSNDKFIVAIKRLLFFVSKESNKDKNWNKDYLLGEIMLHIENKKTQNELVKFL